MMEAESVDIVERWLKKKGYSTMREVAFFHRADIVGFKKPDTFVAVEVKGETGDAIRGIGQAISYGIAADESYIAIEKEMLRNLSAFLDKIPVGVLIIDKNKVRIHKISIRFNPHYKWKMYLKELFETGKARIPIEESNYGFQPSDSQEMRRLKKSVTIKSLWFWILLLLLKKPYHAYAIRNEIRREFGFLPGTVTSYKVLYFLKKGRYVSTKKVGRKVMYSITDKGRKELLAAKEFFKKMSEDLCGRPGQVLPRHLKKIK